MSDKKKILMLLSNPFRPDPRVHKEAMSLSKSGYKVTIICWDRVQKSPGEETLDNIRLLRVGPRHSGMSFAVFPLNLLRFWKNALEQARRMHVDIVHAHDMDTLPLGIMISRLKNVPLVYDAHESYGMMIESSFRNPLAGKLIDMAESRFAPWAHRIILVNPQTHVYRGIFKAMERRVKEKPTLLMNFRELTPLTVSPHLDDSAFKIGYVGVLEPGRNLLEAVEAIGGMENVSFHIRGFGHLEAELVRESKKYGNVFLDGQIKPEEILSFYASCDAIYNVTDIRSEHERVGVPNRLFDAMAVGKPIMVSKGSYAETFVNDNRCGIAVIPTIEGIRKCVASLAADPRSLIDLGKNGRQAFEKKYNWNDAVKGLLALYRELLD